MLYGDTTIRACLLQAQATLLLIPGVRLDTVFADSFVFVGPYPAGGIVRPCSMVTQGKITLVLSLMDQGQRYCVRDGARALKSVAMCLKSYRTNNLINPTIYRQATDDHDLYRRHLLLSAKGPHP